MICQHGFLSYLIAAKESICFHTLLSLKLYFAKDENIFSTGYVDSCFIHRCDRSRCGFSTICALFYCGFPYFRCFSIEEGVGARPRVQAADQSLKFFGTL